MDDDLDRIELDPEDVPLYDVGDDIFGRVIVRIDRARCLVWVRPPSRWYRFKRWLRVKWWEIRRALSSTPPN